MSEVIKNPKKEKDISSEDYADLLEKYQFNTKELSPGKLLKGKVIKVTSAHVLVDVGFKSEGIIPIDDFIDHQDPKTLQPGDDISCSRKEQSQRRISHPVKKESHCDKGAEQSGESPSIQQLDRRKNLIKNKKWLQRQCGNHGLSSRFSCRRESRERCG